MLDLYSLALPLALLYPLANLFFVPTFFLEKTCCSLGLVAVLDEAQSSHVIAYRLSLNSQGSSKMLTQSDERSTHHSVRYNLVMVRSEKEKQYARGQGDIARLSWISHIAP